MKRAKVLWVDLEMTGLDPLKDRILEVAALATDWNFRELARFEAVVRQPEGLLKTRMVGDFWDKFSMVREQLMAQNKTGQSSERVEAGLLKFLAEHFKDDEPVLLAGNSVHQDRKFIAEKWKKFDSKLHYRMLDVSAWKVVFEGKYRKKFAKPEAHRAVEDIQGSIEELKYYLGKIKG